MKRPREDMDRLDSELIIEAIQTPGYKLIAARIDQESGKLVRQLVEADLPEAQMYRVRGMIQAFRTALEIPTILAKEARAADKHGRG